MDYVVLESEKNPTATSLKTAARSNGFIDYSNIQK